MGHSAQKTGEVVEPAGGETGEPHCLAEVCKHLRCIISLCWGTIVGT